MADEPQEESSKPEQDGESTGFTGAKFMNSYKATADKGLKDMWNHFITRGHQGRITCVHANSDAGVIVTGGVDWSVRVWRYDPMYQAYDIIAVVNLPVPQRFMPTEVSRGLCGALKELIKPTKPNWDREGPQGVTAIRATYLKESSLGTPKDGPILAGTAGGAFYALDYALIDPEGVTDRKVAAKTAVKSFGKLHKSPINDMCAITMAEVDDEDDVTSIEVKVLTVGEDKKGQIVKISTEKVKNPRFGLNVTDDPWCCLIDMLFCGRGLPRSKAGDPKVEKRETQAPSPDLEAAQPLKGDARLDEEDEDEEEEAEEDEEDEADMCLKITSVEWDQNATLQHAHPVLECQELQNSSEDGLEFVTLTKEGAHLWSKSGELVIVLRIDATKVKTWTRRNRHGRSQFEDRKMKCDEHSSLAAVTKHKKVWDPAIEDIVDRRQSLIFLMGEDSVSKKGYVAVWGTEEGVLGHTDPTSGVMVYDDAKLQEELESGEFKEHGIQPICVYNQQGVMLDIDQSGDSTTFAVQVKDDSTQVSMWGLEGVSPGMLALEPDGPASLLVCPGREPARIQMRHEDNISDIKVVEDSEGPVLVTACDNGTVYIWDLEGSDQGQISAQLRSLAPLELWLPTVLVLVTAAQVLSFSFGPAIPWNKELHSKTRVAHKVMMLDVQVAIDINKADIFWPEMLCIVACIVLFLLCALLSVPQRLDLAVSRFQQTWCYRKEKSFGCAHLWLKFLTTLRFLAYLLMQLTSTVLVVPMMQSCAQAVDCIHPDDGHWYDMLTGDPDPDIKLAVAPSVKCYEGPHIKLVGMMAVLIPIFLLVLLPYAVTAGDAHYVPGTTLFDWKFWQDGSAWQLAAARKATDVNKGFLHPTPALAFRTLSFELLGKILLPVISTWTTKYPLQQMIFITAVGFVLWMNSIVAPPYVERKFTILMQSVKLFTVCAMACGILTVMVHDHLFTKYSGTTTHNGKQLSEQGQAIFAKVSLWPVMILAASFILIFMTVVAQLAVIQARSVQVCVFDVTEGAEDDDETNRLMNEEKEEE